LRWAWMRLRKWTGSRSFGSPIEACRAAERGGEQVSVHL
jgi:hypothetical protein